MKKPDGSASAADLNQRYYDSDQRGREDYRRLMAAPQWRLGELARLLEERPPARLVDLGCATGAVLAMVRSRHPGALLVGLDLSPGQIENNRRHHPDGEWRVADLSHPEALPDELSGRFDTLICSEVIEHLDEPAALLRSAGRLAAPGARLLLTTQCGTVRETERRVGHIRHFTAAEMRALLAENGWKPVRVWNAGWPFHDFSKWVANLAPDAMMSRFSERPYGWRERVACWWLRLAFRLNSNRRGAQLLALAEKA